MKNKHLSKPRRCNFITCFSIIIIFASFILNNANAYSQGDCSTAINITVKTKDMDCFSGYTAVNGVTASPQFNTGCMTWISSVWWGKFTATSTSTELFLYGKTCEMAVSIMSGTCPGLTELTCTVTSISDYSVPYWLKFATVVGQTYYVRIARNSSALGARLCLYNASSETTKPFCTSGMSFEDGAGSGWTGNQGGFHLVSVPGTTYTWDLPTAVTIPSPPRFSITSGTGRDPKNPMVTVVAPGGGNYSFRLGAPSALTGSVAQVEGYTCT
ncbi:MAG: hypothetical protein PHD97_09405, partial [Bacteroidales bacterium]|nr:hypothetical protein [Bacteroidales bacterium]